jgi:hypothetical protein
MTTIADNRAVLAIDPGPRGVAFVFFENGTLLDWGTRGRGRNELQVLDAMLDRFRADVLILEDPDAFGCGRRPRWKHIIDRMAECASARGVAVEKVGRYAVHSAWAALGETNKHRVATAIAALFPEIVPCVPPVRRKWDSEDPRTGVFDALSLLLYVRKTETDEATTSQALRACA